MEEIYSEKRKTCKITSARPETLSFLKAFSKSYQVANYENMKFEQFLN